MSPILLLLGLIGIITISVGTLMILRHTLNLNSTKTQHELEKEKQKQDRIDEILENE